MKRLILAASVVMAFAPQVFASVCGPNQNLEVIGQTQTDTAVITTTASEVRLIAMACGSSACAAGLHNVDTIANAAVLNMKSEPVGPANTFVAFPESGFMDPPLLFDEGIVFVDDSNVEAITLYECR